MQASRGNETTNFNMQQAEQNGASPLNVFHQLAMKIRSSQYKVTPEEERLFISCNKENATAGRRGFLLGAALAWGLTRRAKVSASQYDRVQRFLTRLLYCSGSGFVLAHINQVRIEGRCAERLALLDGSPLQGELIAILQQHYPNHELLKKYLKHRSTREVMYDVEGNIVLKRLPAGDTQEHGPFQNEHGPAGNKSPHDPQPAPSTTAQGKQSSTGRKWQANDSQDSDSMFVNFFEFYAGNDGEDSNDPVSSTPKESMKERRRSRMTSEERRTFNRQQYLAREHAHVPEREAVF